MAKEIDWDFIRETCPSLDLSEGADTSEIDEILKRMLQRRKNDPPKRAASA